MKFREYLESDIDLGDVVFDPERKKGKSPYETNTEVEQFIFDNLN